MPEIADSSRSYFFSMETCYSSAQTYPEAHDIYALRAKVFEQTYTRFSGSQKAEAQAREAEIELALEKSSC